MPEVKTTFDRREIRLLAILMRLLREDINNIRMQVEDEDSRLLSISDKLYYKIVGLSDKANRKNNDKLMKLDDG